MKLRPRKIIKFFTSNIAIKLFCIAAAALLWVYVSSGQSSVGKFPGSIKIKAINVPAGLVAIYDVDTVDIKIMASSDVWKKLSSDSFSAYVDLGTYSAGTYEMTVNVVSSEAGVQIVEKSPDKIFVSLEPVISKEVTINKKIEGEAAEGYTAGNVEFDPPRVTATGPKSKIDNLTEAIVVINLHGEAENFEKTGEMVALDDAGDPMPYIEFSPNTALVKVSIVKASNNKTVGIKVKAVGSPASGYFVSKITVTPSVVDITGPKNVISDINTVETEAIDLNNAASTIEREVLLVLKNGASLQSGSLSRVTVRIEIIKISITADVVATVLPQNLSGYTISSYSPNPIKVEVSGPVDIINGLKSADVIVYLNFQGRTISSQMNFDLNVNNVNLPEGVSFGKLSSSAVAVTLSRD